MDWLGDNLPDILSFVAGVIARRRDHLRRAAGDCAGGGADACGVGAEF